MRKVISWAFGNILSQLIINLTKVSLKFRNFLVLSMTVSLWLLDVNVIFLLRLFLTNCALIVMPYILMHEK